LGVDQEVDYAGRQGRVAHNYTSSVLPIRMEGGDRVDYALLGETPQAILRRQYPYPSAAAIFALSTGTVNRHHPFEVLNQSTIKAHVSTFRFFRADIKIRFDFNTTVTDVGVVVISWVPDCDAVFGTRSFLNSDPTIVDLSTMRNVEVVIPWTSIQEWYDLNSAATTNQLVQLEVNHIYVGNINGASAPSYRMFVSFENVEIKGATNFTAIALAQSGQPESYSGEDPNAGRIEIPANLGSLPVTTQTLGTLGALAISSAPTILTSMSKAWGAYDQYKGWFTSKKDKDKQVRPLEQLQEPRPVRNYTYGNLAGASYCPSLQLNSGMGTVVPPYHLGDPNFRHFMRDIIQIPTIRTYTLLTGTHVLPIQPFVSVASTSYLEMMWAMFRYGRGSLRVRLSFHSSPLEAYQITVMWSHGDTTLDIALNSSYQDIVNVRGLVVRDYLVPFIWPTQWVRIDDISSAPSNIWGNLTVRITQAAHSFGSSSPLIFMMVYTSAGPDFQLKDLCSSTAEDITATWEPSSPTPAEAQMHLRSSWNTEFQNIAGGAQPTILREIMEDAISVEDICMRFSNRATAQPIQLWPGLLLSMNTYDNLDYCMTMFRYARGSLRYKVVVYEAASIEDYPKVGMRGNWVQSPTTHANPSYRFPSGNGFAMQNITQNGMLEFELPYYSNYDWSINPRVAGKFAVVPYQFPPVQDLGNFTGLNDYYLVAGGSDFQLAWLMPPYLTVDSIPGKVAYT